MWASVRCDYAESNGLQSMPAAKLVAVGSGANGSRPRQGAEIRASIKPK